MILTLIKLFTGMYVWDGVTSLVQLYLPTLPSDAKISSAKFYAYQDDWSSIEGSTTIHAGKITEPWTGSVTWNTQPNSSYLASDSGQDVRAWWDWDVTSAVQEWYNGSHPNYGLKLYYGGTSGGTTRYFTSPKITINYTVDPTGLEDFWGYTKDGVNPANGNLVFQETDVSVPGRGVPVDITRTYNSRKSQVSAMFGYGWITNVEQVIKDSGNGPITYIDGDGTNHIFGEKEGGGYVSPGGIYLELEKNADDTYTLTQKDGTKINFNINGKLVAIVDKNDNTTSYTYDVNGKLAQITDASGRINTITYGTNGKVESITDSANRTTLYEYDVDGNLIKVTDPKGNITSYAYDTDHNITSITDANNNTATIEYDTSDRVTNVNHPLTIDGTATTSTTSYTYNSSLTTVVDGEGNRVDYTYSPNGNVTEITRNPLDTANNSVITLDYDNYNNLVQLKDANNNEIGGNDAYIFTYDLKGNITGVQLPENQASNYAYDDFSNLIRIEDFNSNVSSADYDASNNQTEATDAKVQTKAKRYNGYGNLKYETKPLSAQDNLILNSSFEADADANNWPDLWTKAGTATFNWSDTAKIGKKAINIANPTTDAVVKSDLIPYEATEKYAFSAYIKTENTTGLTIAKVEFFDNASTKLGEEIAYALKGNHAWTRLQAIVETAPANTANMQISLGLQAGSGSVYFDGIQIEKGAMVTAYNLMENSGFEKDEDQDNMPDSWSGSWNLTAEDGIAQNANPEDDNVYFGNYSFKIKGDTAQNKYIKQRINISGSAGEKLTLSGWSKQIGADPNGGTYGLQVAVNHTDGTTDWRYANSFNLTKDDWQHIAVQIEPLQAYSSIDVYLMYYGQTGTAFFDALRLEYGNSLTVYDYDTNGNYLGEVKNQLEKSIYYSYDAAGNKTAQTDANLNNSYYSYDDNNNLTQVTDAKNDVTAYEYDGNNNLNKVTDARNNVTTYGYNEFNQVKSITNALSQVMQFGYNKNGNANKIVLPKGDVITGTYDALNRLDSILYNGVSKFNISYDPNGNITSVTDAAGKNTSFQYDKNNRVIEVSEGTENIINYSYDANSNVTDITVTEGIASYSNSFNYNALDQMIAQFRNGANLAEFTYDENGNLTSVSYSNNTYAVYEYDDANQVKSVQNYRNGELLDSYSYSYDNNGNITGVTTNAGTVSYQYDALNQLTQETLLDGTIIDYSYDAADNRISKTVTQGGTPITTNYTYDAANQLTAVDGQAYTYDANGNLTDNGEKTYVYNEVNQLVEVKDASGTIATFTYDFSGKRISKTTSSGTVNYHYAGDKVVYETDASGNIIAEYTWDQNGRPVSMTKDGVTYYYHVNSHGDVTSLTDENGNVVAEYEYDAWGNILSQSGTMASLNPYRYAAYMYDEETGLYYLMARYYDAEIGRFISRDTFAGFSSNPQSLNLYAYSYNNPVNLVDHNGNSPVPSSYYFDSIDGVYIIEQPGKRSILYNVSEKMAELFNKDINIGGGKIKPMTPEQGAKIRNDFRDMWNRPKTKQAFKNTAYSVAFVHNPFPFAGEFLPPSGDPEFDKALEVANTVSFASPRKWFDLRKNINSLRKFLNL